MENISDFVEELRKNEYIKERKFGNISSFNFTRKAFYDAVWNSMTTKARGLFINTATNKIVARSYNKFFNIDEVSETSPSNLCRTLKFPVVAYVKENGFLGIVSYNEETDGLFISTKGSVDGEYSDRLKTIFYLSTTPQTRNDVKTFLKENDVSLVFECVDPENDPHIIEYKETHLFLLDAIKNKIEFHKYPYDSLVELSKRFDFEVKKKAYTITNIIDFGDWVDKVSSVGYTYNEEPIEGFVVEDASGFMFKIKTSYYKTWKHIRSLAEKYVNGKISKEKRIGEPDDIFVDFIRDMKPETSLVFPLRNNFEQWFEENKSNYLDKPENV